MLYVGIDPGKDGAIAVLKEDMKIFFTCAMPMISKDVNWSRVAEMLNPESTRHTFFVGIEEVHAIFGSSAKATFNFGGAFHGIIAVIETLRLSYLLIKPKEWQKVMFQGVPEIRKPSIETIVKGKKVKRKGPLKTKEMALIAARRLFPNENFYKSERCVQPHEGIVDALLIAEYIRRKILGERDADR